MASSITQNSITGIYDYLYRLGKMIGTSLRPAITRSENVNDISLGKSYEISKNGTLVNGASMLFLAKATTLPIHLSEFGVNVSSGLVTIELFEAPTISANGTSITPLNKNRNITTPSVTGVYHTPTVTTTGTLIYATQIHTVSQGNSHNAGSGGTNGEWLLKADTDYLFKVTNNSGASITFSSLFFWVEK